MRERDRDTGRGKKKNNKEEEEEENNNKKLQADKADR